MIGIVAFNVLMIGIGVIVAGRLLSTERIAAMLDWLHSIIGITPPPKEKSATFALVWIASLTLLVDGLLMLLVFLTRVAM